MYVISRTKEFFFAFLKEEEGKKDDDDDGRRKKYAREDKKKEREFLSIYLYINACFFFVCTRVSAFAFLSSRERASGSLVGFSASSDDDEKTTSCF